MKDVTFDTKLAAQRCEVQSLSSPLTTLEAVPGFGGLIFEIFILRYFMICYDILIASITYLHNISTAQGGGGSFQR